MGSKTGLGGQQEPAVETPKPKRTAAKAKTDSKAGKGNPEAEEVESRKEKQQDKLDGKKDPLHLSSMPSPHSSTVWVVSVLDLLHLGQQELLETLNELLLGQGTMRNLFDYLGLVQSRHLVLWMGNMFDGQKCATQSRLKVKTS